MFRAEKIRIIRKQEVQKQSRRFIWMETIRFLDNKGTFSIVRPENYSYLYFPIAGGEWDKKFPVAQFRR